MPPCHTTPFIQPGIVVQRRVSDKADEREVPPPESCDYCASVRLEWRKCKLICSDCKQINKSCADL